MLNKEVEENIEVHHQVLTNEEVEELGESPTEKEKDKEDTEAEPATWTLP